MLGKMGRGKQWGVGDNGIIQRRGERSKFVGWGQEIEVAYRRNAELLLGAQEEGWREVKHGGITQSRERRGQNKSEFVGWGQEI